MPNPIDPAVTRRMMLAGIGATALIPYSIALAQQDPPTDPIPHNDPATDANPDSWSPPKSDAGDVNSFKYSFAQGHNRVSEGGWARQVTVRDLPISTTLAGVNMRLKAGAIRELHWHIPAEWAFMLYGTARITAVDSQGRSFISDIAKGDLWYFPGGVPHSIQGLGPDGCEFLLVFDDGKFSEFDTFLITDWFEHTPREVLAKNLQQPEKVFGAAPNQELYIFNAPMPGSLESDLKQAIGPEGNVPNPFDFHMTAQAPDITRKGGEIRIVDSGKFKASTTVASALVTLHPGGLRELHWHPNADEWQYYISGKGRMTLFTGGGKARTMDFQTGDVGYIQQSLPHYIENTGDTDLQFLEIFKSNHYEDISLNQWISHLPSELVDAHLHLGRDVIEAVPKFKAGIFPL